MGLYWVRCNRGIKIAVMKALLRRAFLFFTNVHCGSLFSTGLINNIGYPVRVVLMILLMPLWVKYSIHVESWPMAH